MPNIPVWTLALLVPDGQQFRKNFYLQCGHSFFCHLAEDWRLNLLFAVNKQVGVRLGVDCAYHPNHLTSLPTLWLQFQPKTCTHKSQCVVCDILPRKMSTSMIRVSLFCCAVLPNLAPTFSQLSWTNLTIFLASSVTFLTLYCCGTRKRTILTTLHRHGQTGQHRRKQPAYIGSGAVVTDDLWMVLTEAGLELQLTKISKQLDSSAVHHILAEVNHAV